MQCGKRRKRRILDFLQSGAKMSNAAFSHQHRVEALVLKALMIQQQ